MKNNDHPLTTNTGDRDSVIVCRTSQGFEVRATPLRMTRHVVAFEVYNPYSIVQLSEVLTEFRIIVNDRLIYSGRATVSNLVNTGIMLVCEATLDEAWLDVDLIALITQPKKLREDFANFLKEWERIYIIQPEYKVILADMQNYFMDLRRWLEQVELGIRSYPSGNGAKIEREVIDELAPNILPPINSLFARFEETAEQVAADLLPFHRSYLRRQLHPQLLCSPFAYRTYRKPLGYAGDYEMVNMIMRDPHEGSSIFAKMMNLWFLSQPPATAHRNRIQYLSHHLAEETRRVSGEGRSAQIFNLGCGPAWEIQNFLVEQDLCDKASFTLLDFNDDTLLHTSKILEGLKTQYRRHTPIKMVKKSVHLILKEAARPGEDLSIKYDLIYCAGLFDYLSDRICQRLMETFYAMLAPGGLLLATNVDTSNPIRNMMEYVLDWHLIYRNAQQIQSLCPREADRTRVKVLSDPTGVNTFLEVRKAPS